MARHNRFAEMLPELTKWRRHLHAHPELEYDCFKTAAFVEEKLKSFGVDEVVAGIGRTGVVGLIHGRARASGKVVGLRADMDALPIEETSGVAHSSQTSGKMHACGHDGHMAMLLGAAKYLAETRNFDGTVAVIFQPAEEEGAGALAMVKDGLMERFGIQEVYGMHNKPGLAEGAFALRTGPLMASADQFTLLIEGKGGHAANPELCTDTTLAAAQIVVSLQSVVARNVNPRESVVLSVTSFVTESTAYNVIPQRVEIRGTVRALREEDRLLGRAGVERIAKHTAQAFGAQATIEYEMGYPVTVNHPDQTEFAASVARDVSGESMVDAALPAELGSEDFSYMLEQRPGAFVFIGNGNTAAWHHSDFDFNDEIIPAGCSYWAQLVERRMPILAG